MKKLNCITLLAAVVLTGCSGLPQALQPRQDNSFIRDTQQATQDAKVEEVTVVQTPLVDKVEPVPLLENNCPIFVVEDRADITVVGDKYYKGDSANANQYNALIALNIEQYSYGDRFASFQMALKAITEDPKNKAMLDDSFIQWVLRSKPTEVEAKIFIQEMFASPGMAAYLSKTQSDQYKECNYFDAQKLLARFQVLSRSEFKYLYSSIKYVDLKDQTKSDKTYKANLI